MRASLPKVFGAAAAVALATVIGLIAYSVFIRKPDPTFRMASFPANLSEDVVAIVNGYERREIDEGRTKYYIRADKATSFADNHQELENVFLEVYSDDGAASDKISALKAVYVPAENKNFTAYFAGSVNIDTRDQLNVKTEQLTYTKETDEAVADEAVEFHRANVSGRSFGAIVRAREKVVELLKDVEIRSEGAAGTDRATLSAGRALYDQANERIDLSDTVSAEVYSSGASGGPARVTTLNASRSTAFLEKGSEQARTVGRVELFDNVSIESREGELPPTTIASQYALYQKGLERFDLRGTVVIKTAGDGQQTEAKADSAVYQQADGLIDLTGNAAVRQAASVVQGDAIHAELNGDKKIRYAEATDNALARQTTADRTFEVSGPQLKAVFGDGQVLVKANVLGQGFATLVPAVPDDYTKLKMSASRAIKVDLKGEGLLERIETEGRTSISMEVPNRSPDAANKSVSADAVTALFAADGKNISQASAVGDAQLIMVPLTASGANYKTTVTAPRFDCEFFGASNDPRSCVAVSNTRTIRVPTQPAADQGVQTLTSNKLIANFDAQSRELDSLEAIGGAKFNERDRNGTAERIVYTTSDETVRLRGGSSNVWDSKARAKASEIDWNTKDGITDLRGGSSTTYYNPSSTAGAAPFAKSEKPVYITSDSARIDQRNEMGVFTGNARGWQDNNYVRGHRLTISQKEGRFVAEENVQSLLYEAKRKENGVETNRPVFVAAQKMIYTRDDRHIRYENNVDIRQGKDRITGGAADVFLAENNEPSKTEVHQNVIIVQPDRRATGDYVRYEAANEVIFLRGSPATVEDAVQGRTQASEITVNLKENKYVGEGPTKQNSAGRMRSVYKVRNQ